MIKKSCILTCLFMLSGIVSLVVAEPVHLHAGEKKIKKNESLLKKQRPFEKKQTKIKKKYNAQK